jgi:hypothetical protein
MPKEPPKAKNARADLGAQKKTAPERDPEAASTQNHFKG